MLDDAPQFSRQIDDDDDEASQGPKAGRQREL